MNWSNKLPLCNLFIRLVCQFCKNVCAPAPPPGAKAYCKQNKYLLCKTQFYFKITIEMMIVFLLVILEIFKYSFVLIECFNNILKFGISIEIMWKTHYLWPSYVALQLNCRLVSITGVQKLEIAGSAGLGQTHVGRTKCD